MGDRKISDLLLPSRQWNDVLLHQVFGPDLACKIRNQVQISAHTDQPELLKMPLGKSLTAIAYEASFPAQTDQWNWLKTLKLHPRERMFWWRVMMGAIPTAVWLQARGLKETTECPWGCPEPESLEHIITSCALTKAVLHTLARWGFVLPQYTDWRTLLKAFQDTTRQHTAWARLYCNMIYQIWRTRNAKVHSRPHATPTIIAATILEAFTHANSFTFQQQWDLHQPLGLLTSTHWNPPPPGWLKANADGATLSSGLASIAAIIRDHNGDIINAMGTSLQHWDSTQVEIRAIMAIKQLIQPWMYEYKGFIIEGDNQSVIQLMQRSMEKIKWQSNPERAPDLSFLSNFHQVIFSHCYREQNRAAHLCAHQALDFDFVWSLTDPNCNPPTLLAILEEDRHHIVSM